MLRKFKILLFAAVLALILSCYESGSGGKGGGSFTDSIPGGISVKVIPDSVSVTSGSGSAYLLFDGDTGTSGPVYGELSVNVKYSTVQNIKKIKVFDSGAGSVTLLDGSGKEIKGLSLNTLNSGKWLTGESSSAVSADTVTFKIKNSSTVENPVSEIEIWTSDSEIAENPDILLKSLSAGSVSLTSETTEKYGTCVKKFSCAQSVNDGNLKEFTFDMNIPSATFKRGIVKFDATGLFRGVSAGRRVNGHVYRTGFDIEHTGDVSDTVQTYTDEINPNWLVTGSNTVSFTVPDGVTVSNVTLLLFTDNGWNSIDVSDETDLFDGDVSTGVKYFQGDAADFEFDREVEPSELVLNVSGISSGTILLRYYQDGEWYDFKSGTVPVKEGYNSIEFPEQVRTSKFRIMMNDIGGAACASINEVRVSSSPVGNSVVPRIVVNYPVNGEYFGSKGYIDGYIYPSGENISIEGFTDGRGAGDGSFSIVVDRGSTRFASTLEDLPWYPVIKGISNGVHVSKEVSLYSNYNSTSSTSSDTTTGSGADTESDGLQSDGSYAVTLTPESGKTIDFQGVTLKIPAGAVKSETRITIKPLSLYEMPNLDPGLINVTWPAAGYRFLPHGKFEKDIEVFFKYAKESLKSGFKDEDVFMYYFDETEKRWKRLERVGVEPATVTVTSKTNHFTDIINATLTVPEHPESLSYNPNTIKDLKAGDPASKVNLIEPPKVSNTGEATVSYPIELPKGRRGLAPSVSLNYSSEGGNSWTGIGWNVPVQSITVDTKFGVPRYDKTEMYLLDGQSLSEMPGGTESLKQYRQRVEGSFARIQRFGNTPAEYYWIVTDKNGTKRYYGQTKTGTNISVLQSGEGTGGIYQWCLEKVVDTYGNCINYYYEIDTNAAGKQIYLLSIRYTGYNGSDWKYSVNFGTSDGRSDVTTNGRPGFMTSTAKRLDTIEVRYSDSLIRGYKLNYDENVVFGKTRLGSVSQYGSGGPTDIFNTHTFEYYEDADENNIFRGISSSIGDSVLDYISSAVSILSFMADKIINNNARNWGIIIGKNESVSASGSITAWIAPFSYFKRHGFGLTLGAGTSDSFTSDSMIDLDGDGRPDLVYKNLTTGEISYRKNLGLDSDGKIEFDEEKTVSGLDNIGGNYSWNYFLGPEFPSYIPINLTVGFSKSSVYGYFTDVNGDGLVDFINAGWRSDSSSSKKIYYNNTSDSGEPVFKTTPPQYGDIAFTATGEVDLTGSDIGQEPTWNYMHEKFYLDDPLRIWRAPFTGVIKITGNVKIADGNKPLTSTGTDGYETDGVKVFIQKNDKLLWSEMIADDAVGIPSGVNEIFVEKGDEIIFRVNSIDDGAYDIVEWDPLIEYTSVGDKYEDYVDENGKKIYKFQASEDFSIFGRKIPWVPSMDGKARLEGTFTKGVTSDDVVIRFVKYTKKINVNLKDSTGNVIVPEPVREVLFTRFYGYNEVVTNEPISHDIDPVLKTKSSDSGDINEWEEYYLEVFTETPVDLSKVVLKSSIYYTKNDESIDYNDEMNDTRTFLNASFVNHRPLFESAPNVPWIAPRDGVVTLNYSVESLFKAPFTDHDNIDVPVTIAVKRNGLLLKKINGTVNSDNLTVTLTENITVSKDDRLYFVLSSELKDYRQYLQIGLPSIEYENKETFTHPGYEYEIKEFDRRLGGGYRNWFYARWCGNEEELKHEKMLEISKDTLEQKGYVFDSPDEDQQSENTRISSEMVKTFKDMGQASQLVKPGNTILPESTYKKAFYQSDTIGVWFGNDNDCWISGDKMASTRVVQKSISGVKQELVEGDEGNFVATVIKNTSGTAEGAKIKKITDTWDISAKAGVDGVSGGVSTGKSKTSMDYFDVNGDRFPDVITNNTIQYTKPDGSLGEKKKYSGNGVRVERTFSADSGVSFGSKNTSRVEITGGDGTPEKVTYLGQPGPSFSISAVVSSTMTSTDFIDINGDGLPDYVYTEGENGNIFSSSAVGYIVKLPINVKYNIGYDLTGSQQISSSGFIRKKELIGGSPVKAGFNIDDDYYSGGFSKSISSNELKECYMDVNGDGLPDKVKVSGNRLNVRYNTGSSFTSEEGSMDIGVNSFSSSVSNTNGASISASAAFAITLFGAPICTIGGTLGISGTLGSDLTLVSFDDLDGDGFIDILVNDKNGNLKVAYNKTGKTNLLRSITNPIGGKTTIDYERKGNTYDMPQSKYVMNSVTVEDGRGSSYKYKYNYENGKYDRGEREFYGFAKVTETMPDESRVEKEYYTTSIYRKGIEHINTVYDKNGGKFTVTTNKYNDRTTEAENSIFVELIETKTDYHEGSNDPKITSLQQYIYDAYGNVTEFQDLGDRDYTGDNVIADIIYEYREDTYLMALPVQITVKDSQGAVLRQRSGVYDTKGGLRTVTQTAGSESSTTSLDYYENGNLKLITYPPNERSQRYGMTYTYDVETNTYVTMVEDIFGLRSQWKYDLKFGTPIVTSDTNRNTFYYYYDTYGRTTRIVGPYDVGNSTISYSYDISARPATCITRNRGYWETNDYVDTIVRIDGLKRTVSTAVTSEVNGDKGYTVSGAVVYDNMGRVIEQGQPDDNTTGAPIGMSTYTTKTYYDAIGRKSSITLPDGNDITFKYGTGTYGGKNTLVTTVTDQNDHKKTTHKDVRDNTVAVIEPGDITTTYEYSTMNEITKVTDADGKMTTMKYDGFGRRTEINNPDTGRTLFAYDTAGNMTRKITAELNAKGKQIKYRYDHNRLVQVDYPETEDVYYTYGAAGSANNRAGRVYRVDNGTVAEELYFGRLGETIKSVKTIDDSGVKTTYTTKYEFDNMGRMRRLVYPDGEILTYSYGHGGLLKGAIGETKTGKRVYLENILYDEFGQRTSVKYGNGAESTYTYDTVMRRLTNLKTTSSEGKTLQNIEYEYDDVGNITNRKNSKFNTTDEIERNSEQSYTYDDLDRLETSKGTFDYETWNPLSNKTINSYKSFFSYNQTGKILQKTQTNTGLLTETNETVTIEETTYDWSYEYTGPHPNAVTKAGPRTFSYDLNGNMTTMVDTSKSVTRSLIWDEENRLKQTKDVSTAAGATAENITTYGYDASGTRAIKKGKYGTVEYVSDNYTVRNKDLISKHVYAGNTRLVSRVIMNEEQSGTMVATEQGSYYYHADHLGSSSVVTDSNGKFYEQIEYFPYGETWVHNKSVEDGYTTPYKFTSKEQDPETGFYYYGARYYDAKLSRWVSADPALIRFLPTGNENNDKNLPGMGGIFNPLNIDVYHYGGNNPVKYIDPNGMWDDKTMDVVIKFKNKMYDAKLNCGIVTEGDGDTLNTLAEKQLITETGSNKFSSKVLQEKVNSIKKMNKLKSDKIIVGQKLVLGISNISQKKITSLSENGYVDFNMSGGCWFGLTGGAVLSNNGNIHLYFGGGFVSPVGGISLTASRSEASSGWNIGAQGQYIMAGQFGRSFSGGGSWFGELGAALGTPGVSITGYYIFNPIENIYNSNKVNTINLDN